MSQRLPFQVQIMLARSINGGRQTNKNTEAMRNELLKLELEPNRRMGPLLSPAH
jgi:hypothetical protein